MTNRPKTIRTAAYLLWISVALELPLALLDFAIGEYEDGARVVGLVVGFAFIGVSAASTYFFSLGRRWARVALLVLFVLGALGMAVTAQVFFSQSPLVGWLSLAQLGALGLGLYLGFSQPGSSHFQGSPENDAAMRAILPVGRSGWAIAAGYLALISVLLLPAPFALFCGVMAVRDIRRNPAKHGMGRAVFGLVMGSLGVAAILFLLLRKM